MRFEREDVRRAFSKWGVRSGSLWYFREGTVVEVSAEKPPLIYVEREDGGLVSNLKEAVMELAGLRKNHRVITEGASDLPPLFIKLDIPEDEPEIRVAGVWLWVKGKNSKHRVVYTISEVTDHCVDYVQQRLSGNELLDKIQHEMRGHPVIDGYFKQRHYSTR